MNISKNLALTFGAVVFSLAGFWSFNSHKSTESKPEVTTFRLGYFPNITHAQALIGVGESRFQKALGQNIKLESIVFNAGPSAVEALLAGSVDLIYVGPNPAINGWVRAKGSVNVIAGVCSGGARLIVRNGANIKHAKDFNGKKLATPQLGNTQDVAARAWLSANGMKPQDKGGTVQVLPIKNADQLSLFIRGDIDAAWAVEPWASRLVHQADGKEFLDERSLWPDRKFTSAVILTTKKYLESNPEIVEKLLAEHVEITNWINEHPEEAKQAINSELKKLTHAELSPEVISSALGSMTFTYNPYGDSLERSAQAAFDLGFLGQMKPDLNGLVDLHVLNSVLSTKKIIPLAEATK